MYINRDGAFITEKGRDRPCPCICLFYKFDFIAVNAVPCRYLVPPPYLAGYAPVLDVVHPLKVGILPVLWYKPCPFILNCLYGSLCKGLYLHIPLRREVRLHNSPAPVAFTSSMLMRFSLQKQAPFPQDMDDFFPCLVGVQVLYLFIDLRLYLFNLRLDMGLLRQYI